MKAFENCLARGRLKEIEVDAERIARELESAREELDRARAAYLGRRWDETVIQSYFATARCARAAINSRGYRDTNLYGLCVALEHLYVSPGDLPVATIKRLQTAKDVKDAVYGGRRAYAEEARDLLQWAIALAQAVFGRISLPGFDVAEIPAEIPEPPDHRRTRLREVRYAPRAPRPDNFGNR